MSWEYAGYLALTLAGTVALRHVAHVHFFHSQKMAAAKAIALTAPIFVAWDMLATARGYWSFGFSHMLGIQLLNQPIEEIAFFTVMSFFGITLYSIAQKWEKKKEEKK